MYNGWPNCETWLVALWLGNDPITDADSRHLVSAAPTLFDAADALKAAVEDRSPLKDQASLYSDLLSAALRMVEWRSIAERYRQDRR